jgi:LPS sulfotransferase NodH
MGNPSSLNGILQGTGNMGLPDDFFKYLRPPFAC